MGSRLASTGLDADEEARDPSLVPLTFGIPSIRLEILRLLGVVDLGTISRIARHVESARNSARDRLDVLERLGLGNCTVRAVSRSCRPAARYRLEDDRLGEVAGLLFEAIALAESTAS